jgi:hypothetical protein
MGFNGELSKHVNTNTVKAEIFLHQLILKDHLPWSVFRSSTSTWNVRHDIYTGTCVVESSGMVTCVPRTVYSSICASDVTYWPYDVINCSLQIGAWMQTGEEITVNTNDGTVSNYIHSRR